MKLMIFGMLPAANIVTAAFKEVYMHLNINSCNIFLRNEIGLIAERAVPDNIKSIVKQRTQLLL